MYSSAFYKLEAKGKLRGMYWAAVLGALIYMIPQYLVPLMKYAFSDTAGEEFCNIASPIIRIFVLNIMYVGFLRFLMRIDSDAGQNVRYNDVLTGYTLHFWNTLKIMFLRDLYILARAILVFVPFFVVIGVIAYMSLTTSTISELYSMLTQLMLSPTYDMLYSTADFIEANCAFLPFMTFAAFAVSVALLVPLIYKVYEYAAVPMILAQYPNMGRKEVFARTKDIMTGYRCRYFLLQLSFCFWIILVGTVTALSGISVSYYVALAVLYPYMYKTFLEFYMQRTSVVEHNIEVYGNDEI